MVNADIDKLKGSREKNFLRIVKKLFLLGFIINESMIIKLYV